MFLGNHTRNYILPPRNHEKSPKNKKQIEVSGEWATPGLVEVGSRSPTEEWALPIVIVANVGMLPIPVSISN